MYKSNQFRYDFNDMQNIEFKLVLQYLGVPILSETPENIYVDLKGKRIEILKVKNRYLVDKHYQNIINYTMDYRGCSRREAGDELYKEFKSVVDSYKKRREMIEFTSSPTKRIPEKKTVDIEDLFFSTDKTDIDNNNTNIIQLKQNQVVKIQMLNSEMKVSNTIELRNI